MDTFPHRKYPCNECPFRRDNADNPASQFPSERWAELRSTVRRAGIPAHLIAHEDVLILQKLD